MKISAHLNRSLRIALSAGALALVLAACGSSSSSSSSASDTGATAGGQSVPVTLKDFSITMPRIALQPGSTTFTVTNNGPSPHNLTINGPGVDNEATPTFPSGTKTLTVTLQKGTYEFYCSVPGHKAAGMDVKVTVG